LKSRPQIGRAWLLSAVACVTFANASLVSCQPITPRADHHQHLQSPYAVALANTTLSSIAVPAEVERLLRKREERWNQPAALQELFTQSSQVFTGGNPGWAQGAGRSAEFLSTRFARPYTLTPTGSHFTGRAGWISGYYTRGEGTATTRPGYFHLSLEKADDGEWRISSEVPSFPGPPVARGEDASKLIGYLDEAGIRFGVVLSEAFFFDSPRNDVTDRLDKVRAENDWTADQVTRFKDRLVAFCSFNPLADHALGELERCAASGRFVGIKLHFGTSGVDLKDARHIAKVRAVVEAANRHRMPLIVHVRAGPGYGKEEARVLLDRIVSAAPDVPFQIAHLWGGEQFSADALAVYADAVSRGEPATRKLYFDLAEVALVLRGNAADMQTAVALMRKIGIDRILYATDGPVEESQSPFDGWKETQRLPLSKNELAAIARNVAPYLRNLSDRRTPSKRTSGSPKALRSEYSATRPST
jgi:predicted TIM-barrel fold metal-dependent hydrolase